jgi:hypothetical protein
MGDPSPGVCLLVKVGVAESNRVIEIETEDPQAFRTTIEEAFSQSLSVIWFEDTKRRLVGIPIQKLAYVEIEQDGATRQVGFGRGTS